MSFFQNPEPGFPTVHGSLTKAKCLAISSQPLAKQYNMLDFNNLQGVSSKKQVKLFVTRHLKCHDKPKPETKL
jgi:hypothetical protein